MEIATPKRAKIRFSEKEIEILEQACEILSKFSDKITELEDREVKEIVLSAPYRKDDYVVEIIDNISGYSNLYDVPIKNYE